VGPAPAGEACPNGIVALIESVLVEKAPHCDSAYDEGMQRHRAFAICLVTYISVWLCLDSVEAQASDTQVQQLWVRQVDQFLHEPPGWGTVDRHQSGLVAFSPDDTRLAVIFHHYEKADKNVHLNIHLFIIDTGSSTSPVRQYDVAETRGDGLSWNERGDTILVYRAIDSRRERAPKNFMSALNCRFGDTQAAEWMADKKIHLYRGTRSDSRSASHVLQQ
jgi:hypothetical protein